MTERRRLWKMAGEGGVQLVIGARSALYLPFRDLGLIVIDEEHDQSYKQEDGVVYSARDMAVLRASLCSAQVVLASATPSLESWVNAQAGKYRLEVLTERVGDAVMPEIAAIDMRAEELASGRWVSPTLQAEVNKRLELGEQSLIFLNRRGYAPITLCRACGHQIGCDHCDARHCIGVANGLDALTLTLKAWRELGKINKGDEVIVPGNTYRSEEHTSELQSR